MTLVAVLDGGSPLEKRATLVARGNLDPERLKQKETKEDWGDDMVEEPAGAPGINGMCRRLLEAMVHNLLS